MSKAKRKRLTGKRGNINPPNRGTINSVKKINTEGSKHISIANSKSRSQLPPEKRVNEVYKTKNGTENGGQGSSTKFDSVLAGNLGLLDLETTGVAVYRGRGRYYQENNLDKGREVGFLGVWQGKKKAQKRPTFEPKGRA